MCTPLKKLFSAMSLSDIKHREIKRKKKMEEIVFYCSEGAPDDKQGALSLAVATTLHSQTQTVAFRQAASYPNGAVITGTKPGDRVIVAAKGKALINVYSWGKESPDQRIPVPEQLACLVLCPNNMEDYADEDEETRQPKFRLPYLLIGGGVSGKLYVWELNSGLLLNVKEAHYQMPTSMKITSDGSFLVTAGKDARVLIWKITDLVGFSKDDKIVRPIRVLSDHTLEVTDVFLSNNVHQDSKLYTVSKDSTIRVYSMSNFQLLSTFVINGHIECLCVDSADRVIYVGLSDGSIRQINLYQPNPATNILESVGGAGKIVTLQPDHELKDTITYHLGHAVTQLSLSLDCSLLISGDSKGRVAITDVVSKQVVKELKELNNKITTVKVMNTYTEDHSIDKNTRAIPIFKRVITSNEAKEQDVLYQISAQEDTKLFDIDAHLERVSQEAMFFENFTNVNSQVIIKDDDKLTDVKQQLEKVTKAYTDLRAMYEELYSEHSDK